MRSVQRCQGEGGPVRRPTPGPAKRLQQRCLTRQLAVAGCMQGMPPSHPASMLLPFPEACKGKLCAPGGRWRSALRTLLASACSPPASRCGGRRGTAHQAGSCVQGAATANRQSLLLLTCKRIKGSIPQPRRGIRRAGPSICSHALHAAMRGPSLPAVQSDLAVSLAGTLT